MVKELYAIKIEVEGLKKFDDKDKFLHRIRGAITYMGRYKGENPYNKKILADIKLELDSVKRGLANDQ